MSGGPPSISNYFNQSEDSIFDQLSPAAASAASANANQDDPFAEIGNQLQQTDSAAIMQQEQPSQLSTDDATQQNTSEVIVPQNTSEVITPQKQTGFSTPNPKQRIHNPNQTLLSPYNPSGNLVPLTSSVPSYSVQNPVAMLNPTRGEMLPTSTINQSLMNVTTTEKTVATTTALLGTDSGNTVNSSMGFTNVGTVQPLSPNASMDLEATIVKFQHASIDDDSQPLQLQAQPMPIQPSLIQSQELQTQNQTLEAAPTEQVPVVEPLFEATPSEVLHGAVQSHMSSVPNTVPFIAPTVASVALTSDIKPHSGKLPPQTLVAPITQQVTSSEKTDGSKLFNYFSNSNVPNNPFDIIGNRNSLSDSSMMNPAYMSPTEGFNISHAIPSPDSFLTPATEQDVFTASLLSSDADRRHDAWIPSEATRSALVRLATSPPGTYLPDKELLTLPGIAVKEDFGDPVKNLVRQYLGEDAATKRQVVSATSVTQDDRGLRQLIGAGCYHAAVNLTTQLLTVYGQGEGKAGHPSKHTAHSIQLWFTRIALLIKLRRFSLAEVECQYFDDLDAPDLYFEFYPELYGGRKGSMVPFGFRLLVAELPQYLGKHTQALDRLNALLTTCDKIILNLSNGLSEYGSGYEMTPNMREDSLKLWRTRRFRVLYAITNCAVSLKDFRLSGGMLEKLIHEDSNSAAGLCSALGRLCLQLGDIKTAQNYFNQYLEYSLPPPHHDQVQGLLHSAYIAIAQNDFIDATNILSQAHKINNTNGLVINNLGVCLMYTGRVREAIDLVEGAVFSQPERFLHEALVLNLATMYELESSNAHQNKLKLLSLISQHKGDSFNVAALKLQPQP
ncbi:unnamed protein product, partial [Meganyctiphanes norvegica]